MNPFDIHDDPDRYQIWQRLVAVDCEAFAAGDWSLVEVDFDADAFQGVRCFHSSNPDDWRIVFPTLASYRGAWLASADQFRAKSFARHSHLEALLIRTRLDEIDIQGDHALAHKKFFGDVEYADGTVLNDRRQTMFQLRRHGERWKIVGFLGQLPLQRTSDE
jgi:hypothetical protein